MAGKSTVRKENKRLRKIIASLTRELPDIKNRFTLCAGILSRLVSPLTYRKAQAGLVEDVQIRLSTKLANQIVDICEMNDISKYFAPPEGCPRCTGTVWIVDSSGRKCLTCEAKSEAARAKLEVEELKKGAHALAKIMERSSYILREQDKKRIERLYDGAVPFNI